MPKISLLPILLSILTTKFAKTTPAEQLDLLEDETGQRAALPSLLSRLKAHDFCADREADFWLADEDRLPADTHFVPCHSLDDHWVDCEPLTVARVVNDTKMVFPCPHFGTAKDGRLHYANVTCRVLPCVECHGQREFKRTVPCKKYTGYYFLSALLYSIFLGLFAVDRFYLGYSAIAVGKLMTLGGLGVWWVVDIFLLVNGQLRPADGSEWQPFWTAADE